MDLFTKDWSTCFEGNVKTGEGVASLTCIWVVLSNVINAGLALSGVVAIFLIVYSGFQYVTSGGDKEKLDNARKRLTYAILGLVFITLSFLVVTFIAQFTGLNVTQLTTPPGAQKNLIPNVTP